MAIIVQQMTSVFTTIMISAMWNHYIPLDLFQKEDHDSSGDEDSDPDDSDNDNAF